MKGPTSPSSTRSKRFLKYPHCHRAHQYALDVVSGKIPACKLTVLSCKRFIDDLEKSKSADYPFEFNPKFGERVCRFAEKLPHVKGKWARHKILDRLIKLEPWQEFLFTQIIGWVEKKTGLRRYREAYIEVPRKNGKSVIAAVLGNYFFLADHEPGAEIYCGATTEKQALEVFRPARRMVEIRPELKKHFQVEVLKQGMKLPDESLFQPIIGKPGDGSSPHLAILDEYHEHPDSSAYDAMQTGMGAREQPLLLIITTAGFNTESPCREKHEECRQILEGSLTDERQFALIYSIDSGDDPYTLEALIKANPNYGVSVEKTFLERQMETAKVSPSKQNKYLVKHLNVWTTAEANFFNMTDWNALADPTLKIEDFKGCRCAFAVDLASKLDLCAIAYVFVRNESVLNGRGIKTEKHYYVFTKFYLPEETIDDTENLNFEIYQKFIRTMDNSGQPILTEVDGAETDFDEVHGELQSRYKEFLPRELGFDTWNALQLMQDCEKDGMPVVEIPQNARNLSPGMKEIESAIKSKRIHHDGNPILAWNMSNVVAHEDKNGNYKPNKPRPSAKIDGAVALIMAVSRAMLFNTMTAGEAISQGHGVRTL